MNITNIKLLNDTIKASGIKRCVIADKIGISRQAFSLKCKGEREFKGPEVFAFCRIMGITEYSEAEKIFFADNVGN